MKLYYTEQGAGFPLLILHGLYGSSDNWISIAKELAPKFRVILVDLRNHGRSPFANEMNYALMAQDVLSLAAELKLERFSIIGHSMGGKVAMRVTSMNPNAVKKLVAVDISPFGYKCGGEKIIGEHSAIIDGLRSLPLHLVQTRQEADDFLSTYVPNVRVRQFLLKNLKRSRTGCYYWQLNVNAIALNVESIMDSAFDQGSKVRIETQTLFVKGEISDYLSTRCTEQLPSHFNNFSVVEVPNAGHWLHAEQPQLFVKLVTDFFGN